MVRYLPDGVWLDIHLMVYGYIFTRWIMLSHLPDGVWLDIHLMEYG